MADVCVTEKMQHSAQPMTGVPEVYIGQKLAHLCPRGVKERSGRIDEHNAIDGLWCLNSHCKGEDAAE